MSKKLLAAGIVRDIEFCNPDDAQVYIYRLDHQDVLYKILDQWNRPDGSVIVRIVQQYNNSPLVELYEEGS